MDFIKSLPAESGPEAFGLHANASIAKTQLETSIFFAAVIQTQGKMESGGGKSNEEIVINVANLMLQRLPEAFVVHKVMEKYPVNYLDSMNTVLVQEVIRFRNLTESVRSSLVNVTKAMKGLVVMSGELEDVCSSILKSTIPRLWASKSFPSMKPLEGYFNDLLARLAFFNKWIDEGPPVVFWLSGFFFTQSFLTGCLQNYARKYTLPIDLLIIEYVIESAKTSNVRPDEGQYINGLYLEGARWDSNQKTITDSRPRVLYDSVPMIWLKPIEKTKASTIQSYDCPVYKTGARRGTLSTTGHSTNFVMSMKIPTNVPESKWIARGVAVLLSLND